MKNYLSFGGGVNSVAMYLLLMDQGMEPGDPDKGFEAVFVDHGTDWPETYEYVEMFKSKYPLTVLKPDAGTVEGRRFDNLYDYYKFKKIFPVRGGGKLGSGRTCTHRFKIRVVQKYVQTPCFMHKGIDYGEQKRARISTDKGIENRYPLIESEIDRVGCEKLIIQHGLNIPMKSGCFICPFQKITDYIKLRSIHQELFCKVEQLENGYIERRRKEGKNPIYIKNIPIRQAINEKQSKLWAEDEYPPCECML